MMRIINDTVNNVSCNKAFDIVLFVDNWLSDYDHNISDPDFGTNDSGKKSSFIFRRNKGLEHSTSTHKVYSLNPQHVQGTRTVGTHISKKVISIQRRLQGNGLPMQEWDWGTFHSNKFNIGINNAIKFPVMSTAYVIVPFVTARQPFIELIVILSK